MTFKTRRPSLTRNNGELAGLTEINPEYIKQEEDQRLIMHDPRVIKIEAELAPTATPQHFMDAVSIFSDEYDVIRREAVNQGFTPEEAAHVAWGVQQMRRDRAFTEDDVNPRLNYLSGDRKVYEIAQKLNEFDFVDGFEIMISRFRELHVHEDDFVSLVNAVKRRVAISDQYQEGLRIAA